MLLTLPIPRYRGLIISRSNINYVPLMLLAKHLSLDYESLRNFCRSYPELESTKIEVKDLTRRGNDDTHICIPDYSINLLATLLNNPVSPKQGTQTF